MYDDSDSKEEGYPPVGNRGSPGMGPSSPAVIRGGLAVLMVAIILDQHGCRAVSHYTRVLVRDR